MEGLKQNGNNILGKVIFVLIFFLFMMLFLTNTGKHSEPKKEIINVSIESLASAFDNEAYGNKTYKDKIIQIRGSAKKIEQTLGVYYLTLTDGNKNISCSIDTSEIDKLSKIKIGDEVSIIGTCEGKLIYVSLKDCTIQ